MNTGKNDKTAKTPQPVEVVMTAGKEAVESAVRAGTEVAARNYEKVVAVTKEQVKSDVKAGSGVVKNYEDYSTFGKKNINAFVTSGTILVKGVQELNEVLFGLARKSMEDTVNANQAILGCKNFQEMVDVQSGLAKESYDKIVSVSRKVSDLSAKLAEDVMEPINDRVTLAVETLAKPIAA